MTTNWLFQGGPAAITTAAQDLLSEHQNWTLLSILGTVLVAVIGLLVWVVKWLCSRFASSVDRCSDVVGEGTQTLSTALIELRALKDTIHEVPQRTADELMRRKIP